MVDRYCLIGGDVTHSLSPAMMNAAFASMKIDAEYRPMSIARKDFPEKFLDLRGESKGMNVTIPYKSDVIPFVDELDEVASRIGAVNVIKHEGDRFLGYNTDAGGIVESLKDHGRESPRTALLVGAGGAARAFCEAMHQLRCGRVTVVVREASRGERFIVEMERVFPGMKFGFTTFSRLKETDADVIFNATPVGSGDHEVPESLKRVIYGRATVFDAVYRPMKTELLRTAELRGCHVIYGYEMLLNQGVLALENWTGRPAPRETMRKALLDSLEVAA
ncbi:MAG: shikimate dehydrogenase [Nitrososphaerota archaeon]|nr:shikimate dehydrogenase [Nitrososphaerota archaeon]